MGKVSKTKNRFLKIQKLMLSLESGPEGSLNYKWILEIFCKPF